MLPGAPPSNLPARDVKFGAGSGPFSGSWRGRRSTARSVARGRSQPAAEASQPWPQEGKFKLSFDLSGYVQYPPGVRQRCRHPPVLIRAGGQLPKGGVRTPFVIPLKPILQACPQRTQGSLLLQVEFTVFHADGDSHFRRPSGPFLRGEPAALLGAGRRETASRQAARRAERNGDPSPLLQPGLSHSGGRASTATRALNPACCHFSLAFIGEVLGSRLVRPGPAQS